MGNPESFANFLYWPTFDAQLRRQVSSLLDSLPVATISTQDSMHCSLNLDEEGSTLC